MQPLLTVIVTWLSINFGLPQTYEHLDVEFVSTERMAEVRLIRLDQSQPDRVAVGTGIPAPPEFGDVHAIYDDRDGTIYLSEEWTGRTPAEISVLVHELVHHLQSGAGLKYDCAEAREKLAYQAQARRLELFDTTLAVAFGIDPMTLLVRTNCMG